MDCRHTFATWAIAAGVQLFYLSRIMGTSITQIDATYGHLVPDSEDYLRNLLDTYDAEVSRWSLSTPCREGSLSHRIACGIPRSEGGIAMYVRLVSFSGGSADMRDSWAQTIQDTVLPTLRGHEGFAGYIGLIGTADQQVKGLVFFDSEENAEAAERAVQERRREVSGGVGLTVESADLYEVLAMEMESTRV